MVSRLRVLRSRSGRAHTPPQARLGDPALEVGVEIGGRLGRPVDVLVAKHGSSHLHPVFVCTHQPSSLVTLSVGEPDIVLGHRPLRILRPEQIVELGLLQTPLEVIAESRGSGAAWSSSTRRIARLSTPAPMLSPNTRRDRSSIRCRSARPAASTRYTTSEMARLRPLAPVGGTTWAASPARSSLP